MNYDHPKRMGIKHWAEEDRPREKLILKGRSALSNAELLAILLGSGTRNLSAVGLAKEVLSKANNDLSQLAKFSLNNLIEIKGIGQAKALTILAAMEFYRRRLGESPEKKKKINSSIDAFQVMKPQLMDLQHEEFWILMLNRANFLERTERVSIGGLSETVADPKMIFGKALEAKASSLIMVHNHPSGNLKASEADLSLTKKMVEAGASLDLPVLDHIIFTNEGYLSFADEGMI